jgi:hypothetical protein
MMRTKFARLLHGLADAVGGIELEAERENEKRATDALARISLGADRLFKKCEEEEKQRAAMGLLDADAPRRWYSYYYMQQGYRISEGGEQSQDHWRGGPVRHEDAECPICCKPLLLFWDINCNDLRSRGESPELLGDLDRLPLYYCCRRPEPTIYQVLTPDRIRTIRPELHSDEESPFEDFPNAFERRPLGLEPIPRDVANLLIVADNFDFGWLTAAERDRLSEYLHDRISSIWSIHLSQFGGAPVLTQGHRELDCPNPACLTHKMGHPVLRHKRHFYMKELAVIDVDAGFEMKKAYAQIVFHICWKCLTIHADYRCS